MSVGLIEAAIAIVLLVSIGWWASKLKKKPELSDEEWRLAEERKRWQQKVEAEKVALEALVKKTPTEHHL